MADRIEQQIQNAEKAIESLTKKIVALKEQLGSGDWGTQQLREFSTQLEKLEEKLSAKQARRVSLIDSQSTRDAERLNKALETTRRQLEYLRSEQKSRAAGNAPFLSITPELLEKEIAKYERAVKTFQSRLAGKQLKPSNAFTFTEDETFGLPRKKIDTPDKSEFEKRINGATLGINATNNEIQAQTEKTRKIFRNARQIASEVLGGVRDLGGATPGAKEGPYDINKMSPLQMEEKDISARLSQQANAVDKQQIERNLNLRTIGFPLTNDELKAKIAESRKIAADILYGKPGTGENGVPVSRNEILGGFQQGDIPHKVSLTTEESAAVDGLEKQTKELTAAQQRRLDIEKKLAAEQEARINRVKSDARYTEALQQAEARNFKVTDLRGIEDRGGNVQRLQFQRTDENGINQKFSPYVNMNTGRSTPGLSSQFRTFGSDILRDIGQFTKWSIAIAAVYTPMQKLGELITIMIDNESRLADATIAANVPFEKSGEIFDTVAVSANQAGESINTTIDAYTQAIRAAGRYNTEQEKSAQATALLNDSLILSKLSTLDQSNAIDTLSAALLQSDRELNQGQELLNKWVRVSQLANVGIDALATGVAVLGDAAETSGLSIDQLNGLIAVLSEQSISGSKEAANTAKALVGAYQSDKAEAALNKYGIALRRANGEVRGFLEIYQELSNLRQQGALSEAAVSEVALALGGGGVRRAKDASALINSTERLNALAEESAKVTGDDSIANDALAKKLETVQTANTRLANSFQELAQTLGDDGGLLDGLKTLINLLTDAVKFSNELFSVLGRSGPILATVVAGLGAMNAYYGQGGRKEVALARLGAVGGEFRGFGFGLGGGATGAQYSPLTGGGPLADILRMNYRGAGIIGGAGVALQGASNIAAGRNENALANVAGGIIGGAIGAALGGPIGLAAGANIGSAAGDAMVTSLKTHKGDFESLFAPPTEKRTNFDAIKQFFTGTNAGNTGVPRTLQGLTDEEINKLLFTAVGGGNEFVGTARANAFANGRQGRGTQYTQGAAALEILRKEDPEAAKIFEAEKARRDAEKKTAESLRKAQGVSQQTGGYTQDRLKLEEQASVARREQLNRLAKGDITTAEFGRVSNQISGFPATSIKSVTAFGDEITKVSKDIRSTTEAYDAFLYIAENGTQEQINLISGYSDDILTLKGYIENWKPELKGATLKLTFGDYEITSKEDMQKLILDLQKQGSTALGITLGQVQQQQAQKITLPPLVGDYNKPTPQKEYNDAVAKGKEIQLKYYESVGKTDEEIQTLISGIETFYTTVDTGSQTIFKATDGLEQRFYELGKAASETADKFGLQQFDVDRPTLERLATQSIALGQGWAKKFPGFETKPEDTLAITKDGIAKPIHADMKILALLLEKLVDQGQKQLDGQYNIPEGATFWVPLTAAYYRNKGGTGGLDTTGLDTAGLDTNTTATNTNTRALEQLSTVMSNTDRLKLEYAGTGTAKTDLHATNANRLRNLEYPLDMHGANANRLQNAEYPRVPGPVQQTSTSFVQQLESFFRNIFSGGSQGFKSLVPGPLDTGARNFGRTNATQTVTPTTKLDLKFSSNVNLLVDGRILAQTLQSYMASELLRTEQTQGTLTKRYVI